MKKLLEFLSTYKITNPINHYAFILGINNNYNYFIENLFFFFFFTFLNAFISELFEVKRPADFLLLFFILNLFSYLLF